MSMVARQPGPRQTAALRSGDRSTIGMDAIRLRRGLRDPLRRPLPWGEASFAREVELIRCHLAPLRNRRSLTASFGREAFQSIHGEPSGMSPLGPIRAAYAIRWLELGNGANLPAWARLVLTETA